MTLREVGAARPCAYCDGDRPAVYGRRCVSCERDRTAAAQRRRRAKQRAERPPPAARRLIPSGEEAGTDPLAAPPRPFAFAAPPRPFDSLALAEAVLRDVAQHGSSDRTRSLAARDLAQPQLRILDRAKTSDRADACGEHVRDFVILEPGDPDLEDDAGICPRCGEQIVMYITVSP